MCGAVEQLAVPTNQSLMSLSDVTSNVMLYCYWSITRHGDKGHIYSHMHTAEIPYVVHVCITVALLGLHYSTVYLMCVCVGKFFFDFTLLLNYT